MGGCRAGRFLAAIGFTAAMLAPPLGVVPDVASAADARPSSFRDNSVTFADVPVYPGMIVGAGGNLNYFTQTDFGTAAQELYMATPKPAQFHKYASMSPFGHGDAVNPVAGALFSAVGDVDEDGGIDTVIVAPQVDFQSPDKCPASHLRSALPNNLLVLGSQHEGFPVLACTPVDRTADLRGLTVLEAKRSGQSDNVVVLAGVHDIVAYRYTSGDLTVVQTDPLAPPAGSEWGSVVDVWHRHDWDRDRGEAKPHLDNWFTVLVKTGERTLRAWLLEYKADGNVARFNIDPQSTEFTFETEADKAAIRYDWVRFTNRWEALAAVAVTGNTKDVDVALLRHAGPGGTAGPIQLCGSRTTADLDLEYVQDPTAADDALPLGRWFAACAAPSGGSLRSAYVDGKLKGGNAATLPGRATDRLTARVGDATTVSTPESQIVFPCLWLLSAGNAGGNCSATSPAGDADPRDFPGTVTVATVANTGTTTTHPTYISRSWQDGTPSLRRSWHVRNDESGAAAFVLPTRKCATDDAGPCVPPRQSMTLELDSTTGTLTEGLDINPVPIALLAAPPQVAGAGQEPAASITFARSRSVSGGTSNETAARIGGYIGMEAEDPTGLFGGSFQESIEHEVTDERAKSFSVTMSDGYSGVGDDDVLVFQRTQFEQFTGSITDSSTGIAVGTDTVINLPLKPITTSATVEYLAANEPAFGEGGALAGLLDGPGGLVTHEVGDPGSYLHDNDLNGYCDGTRTEGEAQEREWRYDAGFTPPNDFPIRLPVLPPKPDILESDVHSVLIGSSNSEGANVDISQEESDSRVSSLSLDVEVGGKLAGITGGVTGGVTTGAGNSMAIGTGATFDGWVGHIPVDNEYLQKERYNWRMFVCQKTVDLVGTGEVPVWVMNWTVSNYKGSGGLEPMSDITLTSPRRSAAVADNPPTLRFEQPDGSVRLYDWELEAVGAEDHRQGTLPEFALETAKDRAAAGSVAPADIRAAGGDKPLHTNQLYRWRVKATDFFGSEVYSPYEYFYTNGPPTADFSWNVVCPDADPCPTTPEAGQTVQFTDTSVKSKVGTMAYSWTFGDGNVGTDQHPTHTYARPGVYPVKLIAKNMVDGVEQFRDEADGTVVVAPRVYTTQEDVLLQVDVADGVIGADGADGTQLVTLVGQPRHGTVALQRNGAFTYQPHPDYCAGDLVADDFIYVVESRSSRYTGAAKIRVPCVNDAPVAEPDTFTGVEDAEITAGTPGVLGNDRDVDVLDTLRTVMGARPAHGAVQLSRNGSMVYRPAADYCGPDSFTYRARDDDGALSEPATVALDIACVNDAPAAGDDALNTHPGDAVTIDVLANDGDAEGGSLNVIEVSDAQHGKSELADDGSVRYVADWNFVGTDSFTYTITDGDLTATATVTVSITPRRVDSGGGGERRPPLTESTGDTVTPEQPLAATIESPNGGPVNIVALRPTDAVTPQGYVLIDRAFEVVAPPATDAANPLVMTFRVHQDLLQGHAVSDLAILRDDVRLDECTGPGATPDPCLADIRSESGHAVVVVRSTHASRWTMAIPAPAPPPPVPACADPAPAGFDDVSAGNVHRSSIDCLVARDVATGTSLTSYGPRRPLTRGQAATLLHKALAASGHPVAAPSSAPVFDDVSATHLHAPAIHALVRAGILRGAPDNRFLPSKTVTRDQLATFVVQAAEHALGTALAPGTSPFSDTSTNAHRRNIDRAYTAGLVAGTSPTTYETRLLVRRDQMATFLVRLMNVIAAADEPPS